MRGSVRHAVHFKLVYDDGTTYSTGYVEDLSESGLFLESAMSLPINAIVRLEPLDPLEDPLFDVRARVVRCVDRNPFVTDLKSTTVAGSHGPVGLGLEFVDLDVASRTRIADMIDELETRARMTPGVRDRYLGVIVQYPAAVA